MKRAVVWSNSARDDFIGIIRFIAKANPDAAAHVADTIDRIVANLGDMATGRPGRVTGTYEKVVPGFPPSSPMRWMILFAREKGGTRHGQRHDCVPDDRRRPAQKSGGPVLDSSGYLLGVTVACVNDGAASVLRMNGVEPKTRGAALTTPQIAAGGKAFKAEAAGLS